MRYRCLVVLFAAGFMFTCHPALSDTYPWPVFRRDAQHTGRSPYLGPATGITWWRYLVGGPGSSSPVVAGGRLYVTGGGRLWAIGLDGALIWSVACGNASASSPAVAQDGTIYIASADSSLYAFNADGTLKWKRTMPGPSESSPTVGPDGSIYVGCNAGKLLAYRADGSLKFTYSAGGAITSSPALAADGTIYFGCDDGGLYAVRSTGTLRWKFAPVPTAAIKSSPSVGSDGTIYVGSMNGFFYAVLPTGAQKWRFATGAANYSSPAVGSDDSIVFGCRDRYVYCISSAGTLKWKFLTGHYVDSSPAVDASGTVYVGSGDGSVYTITPSGVLAWSMRVGTAVTSSPAIDYNRTIYVATLDGYLCAIRSDTTPPATPLVTDDGAYTNSRTTLHACWTSEDLESGIARYEYAIGTAPGAQDIVPFTNAGLDSEVTRTDLNLPNGVDCYFSVRATNGAGLVSEVGISDGIRVDWTPPMALGPQISASVQEIRTRVNGVDSESGVASVQCALLTSPVIPLLPNWIDGLPGEDIVFAGPFDPGLTYYVAARVRNNAGLWSDVVLSAAIRLDTTPPTMPVVVDDGDFWTSSTNLHASWIAEDPESGIGHYLYCLGTSKGASDIYPWTQTQGNSVSLTGLSLVSGATYYFTVRAVNRAGLVSAEGSSDGITVDLTPPTNPIVVDEGDVTWVPDCLSVLVSSTDPESGIAGYVYSLGTTPGASDIVPPTTVGNQQSIMVCGLSLQENTRYYFTVEAVNRAGLKSRTVSTDGIEYRRGISTWRKFRADSRNTGRAVGSIPTLGILRWRVQTEGYVESSAAIGGDGTVYVGSSDGRLYAISPAGTVRWSYQIGSWIDASPAIAADGSIYVGAYNGLYCLSPSGVLKWKFSTSGMVWSSPSIGPDGTVYFGCSNRRFYALTSGGEVKWSFLTGGEIWSSPALAPDGTIYFACGDGKLYALTAAGRLKWTYQTGSAADSSPAIADDGTVYFGSGDGFFYAIRPDGRLRWRVDMEQVVDSSAAIAQDGRIYVGSGGVGYPGKFYAISSDGVVIWRVTLPEGVRSSPAVDATGNVCVGCTSGKVYVFDRLGRMLWSYSLGAAVLASPAVGSDGALVIGSDDGAIYYFRDRAPLDTTPPITPKVSVAREFITPISPIKAWWSSSDPESGIESYLYAIGTQPYSDDVVSWTNVGTLTSISRADLSLAVGRTYYVSVIAVNRASLRSAPGVSRPVVVVSSVEADRIGVVRKRPAGTQVNLPGKIVTAIFDDCFFIEEPDRSAAIRCIGELASVEIGSVVNVQGTTGLRYGEVVLRDVIATPCGFSGSIRPVSITCEAMVRVGVDTTGLLVRIAGRVTRVGSGYAVINDGSRVFSPRGIQGIEVRLPTGLEPNLGDYISVVGIPCRELVNSQPSMVLRYVPGMPVTVYR